MFVSYVVRLRSAQLRRGTFAGEIVGVASGRRYKVASLEQIAAFIKRSYADEEERARQPSLADPEPTAPC